MSKRVGIIALIGFVSIGVLIVVFWFLRNATEHTERLVNYPASGSVVVAFGDSLVAGVGAEKSGGFVGILNERLSLSIHNEGVPGDRTVDALRRMDNVLRHNPDIVLVLLGGNDVLKKVPIDTTFGNLRTIVQTFQEAGALVIVLGVQNSIFFDDFADEFEALTTELGAAYVPNIMDGWFDQTSLKSDPVHPNDEGYMIIADHVEPVLKAMLPN